MKEIQITQNLNVQKYALTCCCSIFIIIVVIFSLTFFPSVMPPLEAAFTATLMIALLGGFSLMVIFYTLYRYRHAGKPRMVSISDNEIRISVPNKETFEVKWDQFDTIQMYKKPSKFNPAYVLNFQKNEVSIGDFDLVISRDFSTSKLKEIRSKIAQSARNMNKDYYWGRRKKK